MDPEQNPYVPNAGAPPPALVGRERLLEAFRIALVRMKAGRTAKSLMPTGLRGVGKTVLLNRFVEMARREDYQTAYMEADENSDFIEMLAAQLRPVLFELDRMANVTATVKRALRIFKSFTLRVGLHGLSLNFRVDPERGMADSGDLNVDLTTLFVAIGEAARDQGVAVLIAIDEVQYLPEGQLAAVLMAVHRTTQLQLPILVVATGLPQLPTLAGNAKSYAERLFDFPMIGALSESDATKAIANPTESGGVTFEDDALHRLYQITEGYPFLIQKWAYHVWDYARRSPITVADVNDVEPSVFDSLAESFLHFLVA